jgi:acyl transferase domain-containing protein
VGDPIEAEAIANTLAGKRSAANPLYMGSIKGNIGHLESCSGIAGLIKTVLILEKGLIPANLNYQYPNEKILKEKWHIKARKPLVT